MKKVYVSVFLLAACVFILGVSSLAAPPPTKYMVMVYSNSSGYPSTEIEVTVEEFLVDGEAREGFTSTTPFAIEVESRDFEVYLTTQGVSQNFTASYMALYKGYWQKAGLTIKNTGSARFVLSDSTGSVGPY